MQNRGPEKALEGYVGEINDCWQSLDKQNTEPNGGSPDGYLGEWIKVDLGGLRKLTMWLCPMREHLATHQ